MALNPNTIVGGIMQLTPISPEQWSAIVHKYLFWDKTLNFIIYVLSTQHNK